MLGIVPGEFLQKGKHGGGGVGRGASQLAAAGALADDFVVVGQDGKALRVVCAVLLVDKLGDVDQQLWRGEAELLLDGVAADVGVDAVGVVFGHHPGEVVPPDGPVAVHTVEPQLLFVAHEAVGQINLAVDKRLVVGCCRHPVAGIDDGHRQEE